MLKISQDNQTDLNDRLVQTIVEEVELARNGTIRLEWPPAPGSTAPGHYFLGVELRVADANDTNDFISGHDTQPIRVLHLSVLKTGPPRKHRSFPFGPRSINDRW